MPQASADPAGATCDPLYRSSTPTMKNATGIFDAFFRQARYNAMLLMDEEGHIDFLETQLELLSKIGEEKYGQLNAESAESAE